MASPITPVEDGFYTLLAASSALTTALGGTSIYIRDVPTTAAPPFVIIETIRSGDMNICPHRLRDTLLAVQAVSVIGAAQAGSLDGLCDAVLHSGTPTITGWTVLHCRRQQDISYRELSQDGREYFRAGGEYSVRITKT